MNKQKLFKASITVFVFIMLGMIIGLYLFGFTSPFIKEFGQASDDLSLFDEATSPKQTTRSFLDLIGGAILSAFTEHIEVILPMLGFGLLAGFTGGSYAGGSVIKFLIMVMLVFVVINIFFFPVVPTIKAGVSGASATGGVAFDPLIIIISVIFNAMLFLTIFTFVSGED